MSLWFLIEPIKKDKPLRERVRERDVVTFLKMEDLKLAHLF